MKTVLTLLWKDFLLFSKDKAAVSLTFLVPMALIYIFGQVFGVNRTDSGPSGIRLAVVNQSENPAAGRLVEALAAEKAFRVVTQRTESDGTKRPLVEDDLRPAMRSNEFRFAVVIPADVVRDDDIGLRLKILSNPRNEIEAQTANGILQKVIFSNVPELLGQSLQANAQRYIGTPAVKEFNGSIATAVATAFGYDRDAVLRSIEEGRFGFDEAVNRSAGDPATGGAADFFSKIVSIENEQVGGEKVRNPMATRSVGGWAIMFLMFSLSGAATVLFDEKKAGLFTRLLSGPVSRAHVLWSKYLFGIALGLFQLVVLFFAGRLMFGIDVTSNFGNLVFACVCASMACTAFGMLLASVAKTPAAANGLATFLILTMSAMGGAWFPLSFMPEFMQTLGKFTITYWSMEGFVAALWSHATFVEMLPVCAVQLAIAAAIMGISLWRFQRGAIFN